MKIIYRINQIVLVTTGVLYLTIFLGLYAQIALGAVQIVSALILLGFWGELLQKTKKELSIYWIIVIIYGFLWLIDSPLLDDYFITTVVVIPMAIACYFLYILYSIKNKNESQPDNI